MYILTKFQKLFIVTTLLLVNAACATQTPTVQPESTTNQVTEPITFSDTVVDGRWTFDTIEVNHEPIDVSVVEPIQMRISESDTADIYAVSIQTQCGDESSDTLQRYNTITISPDHSIEIANQETDAKSCGADRDDANRRFSTLESAVTSYSLDKDVLIFSGVDEASGKPFIIRWVRG